MERGSTWARGSMWGMGRGTTQAMVVGWGKGSAHTQHQVMVGRGTQDAAQNLFRLAPESAMCLRALFCVAITSRRTLFASSTAQELGPSIVTSGKLLLPEIVMNCVQCSPAVLDCPMVLPVAVLPGLPPGSGCHLGLPDQGRPLSNTQQQFREHLTFKGQRAHR